MTTPCQKRLADEEGKFTKECPSDATGAIRIEFWPHKSIQAMVKEPKPLQTMIMNLRVCPSCFVRITPGDLLAGDSLRSLERFAMETNHGIAVDRSQTKLVHVPLDDKDLLLLERTLMEKAAANDSQPAPAGPQPEGAGDGLRQEGGNADAASD